MVSRQGGRRDRESHCRKQQATGYGSVTKDQSGWGVTMKQIAITIREDNVTCCATTSMETVTPALRWTAPRSDSQTTHAIILTDSMSLLKKVKSGMGSPDWRLTMFNTHLQKGSCQSTALDMLESREMTEQTDWMAKKNLSQVACISKDLKC